MGHNYNNKPRRNANLIALSKRASARNGKSVLSESQIKLQINQFVLRHKSGEGYRRLGGINDLLQKYPRVRYMLIDEIRDYVIKQYPLANKVKLCAKPKDIETMLKEISLKDFVAKKYENYPFLLKNQDFYKMVSCRKYRVGIKGYKTGETYKFLNNYIKSFVGSSENFNNSYTDTKFYVGSDKKVVFAKTVRQIFRINDLKKYLRDFPKGDEIEHDKTIAQRGFSVAMYSFLQGKEQQISLFARLDDDGFKHRNLLIDESRKAVFGDVAGFPHFHFQNETDQYLCRKDDEHGYKTGRCNAIDIPHLLTYLKCLESLPKATTQEFIFKER